MSKAIGSASDFYRLRVMTVDTTDAVDFEWRDDILYRRPPVDSIEDEEAYNVEAVLLDDEEAVFVLKTFADSGDAHSWMEAREAELDDMTKSEFEAAYFRPEGL
ncbi:MAG: hypothetical protein JXA36_02445 [Coriobacteriia bacterium]|nr:hypothetical protein [Coriobacteriia bacterium]